MVEVARAVAAPTVTLAELVAADLPREHGFEPVTVEGALPRGLRGTLYRNGPGLFGQFGRRYSHVFEADGAVTAIRIGDGHASAASRITASIGLRTERAAGKLLYGTAAGWPRRVANVLRGRQKNTANTSIVAWQGRVFALMEAAKPTEIDPRELSTIGETDLGVVRSMFSAHPHRVASRAATYNFGLEYGRTTRLHLYELPDRGAARHLGAIELAGPPMLHDFIATDTHLVFFISPVRVEVARMLLQLGEFEQLFRWRPEHGTEVVCVPIDRPAEVVRFTVEPFYQWHFANAFARADQLVVDYIRYPDFASFPALGRPGDDGAPAALAAGRYHRAELDLTARTLRSRPLADRGCEFPTLVAGTEGREHALAYAAFDGLRAIGSIDGNGAIVAHELPESELASEPIRVGDHVLALCHTRERAFVAVYAAARIPDGPVAKIWLDHQVPLTFHGTFVRDAPA
jgi:all-trans-8'-apo-beta-carotenal 15,15'-oxygenase